MTKGGRTRRSGSTSRSRSRSRSITPELMRPWIASLQPGARYRFQTRDNRVSQIGVYVGIERRNFIFMVNGHRTRYPIRLINPVQTGPRPGIEDAFVRLSNGGGSKTKRRKI